MDGIAKRLEEVRSITQTIARTEAGPEKEKELFERGLQLLAECRKSIEGLEGRQETVFGQR